MLYGSPTTRHPIRQPTKKAAVNFKFHHMNLCTDSLPRLTKFYQTLFDLGTIRDEEHTRIDASSTRTGYNGKVDFLSDGAIEFHWAERDIHTGFKMKQFVNPMSHGHFCFRTTTSRALCASATSLAFATPTTANGRLPVGIRCSCKTPTAM